MLARRLLLAGSGAGFHPYDEEWNAAADLANWTVDVTAMPPASYVADVDTTVPGHLYTHCAAVGTNGTVYVWRARIPPLPFTVTALISDTDMPITNPTDCGLGIGQANPDNGYVQVMAPSSYTGSLYTRETTIWANLHTFTDTLAHTTLTHDLTWPPRYLRIAVHSATNIDFLYSADGVTWDLYQAGFNPQTYIPGWTPGSVILSQHVWAGDAYFATWDFVRFAPI